MSSIAGWLARLMFFLALACGSESGQAPPPAALVPAVAKPESQKVERIEARTVESAPEEEFQIEGPEIFIAEPREISAIWAEVIHRREQMGQLFERERIKEIATVAQRLILVSQELGMAGGDFEQSQRIEFLRAGNTARIYLGNVYDIALVQIPGAVPLRLWEMDRSFVALEELIPEGMRGGLSYPKPSEKPPV
jgi:hypothetical protein